MSSRTTRSIGWRGLKQEQPYFLYLSHKAVHAEFVAARSGIAGRYAGKQFVYPKSMAQPTPGAASAHVGPRTSAIAGMVWSTRITPISTSPSSTASMPRRCAAWTTAWDVCWRLCASAGQLDSTLIVYMGDNGFAFGEHGLIDKRMAYEESMRVPLLARVPGTVRGRDQSDAAGGQYRHGAYVPGGGGRAGRRRGVDGRSWLDLVRGRSSDWRKSVLYEYYWERDYPQTPTMHALREERFKFIRYYGIWDIDELYDLEQDPAEMQNLIFHPEHQETETAKRMRKELFARMEQTGGMQIPLYPDSGAPVEPAECEEIPRGGLLRRVVPAAAQEVSVANQPADACQWDFVAPGRQGSYSQFGPVQPM